MSVNPYDPPKAEIGTYGRLNSHELERLASGQRIAFYAIVVHLLCIIVYVASVGVAIATMAPGQTTPHVAFIAAGGLSLIGLLVSLVVGLVGFFKMASGLGIHVIIRVLLVLLIMLPFVAIIILLIMNAMASSRLRAADYQIGVLEAKRRLGAV